MLQATEVGIALSEDPAQENSAAVQLACPHSLTFSSSAASLELQDRFQLFQLAQNPKLGLLAAPGRPLLRPYPVTRKGEETARGIRKITNFESLYFVNP